MKPNLDVSPELLEICKDEIKVTWSHQDNTIEDKIREGMAFIQGKTGPLPFDEKTIVSIKARKLLKEYVRYDWNAALASFEEDYLSDILELQILVAAERRSKR